MREIRRYRVVGVHGCDRPLIRVGLRVGGAHQDALGLSPAAFGQHVGRRGESR